MRFLTIAATVLAVAQGAFAVDIQKAIIMSFPQGTPDNVVNRAMDDIRKAGGTITHEYKLLKYETLFDSHPTSMLSSNFIHRKGGMQFFAMPPKPGFAAKAPQKIIESVTAWSSEYHAVIEEDQIVEISNPTN
ncbi:hypothetical protein F4824DRAFT_496116 [Ustulina deusta]|nr:hypothetical protein F4824DRAFT_496116 [Ustulina deusta]